MKTWLAAFQFLFLTQEALQTRHFLVYPTLSTLKHFFVLAERKKQYTLILNIRAVSLFSTELEVLRIPVP